MQKTFAQRKWNVVYYSQHPKWVYFILLDSGNSNFKKFWHIKGKIDVNNVQEGGNNNNQQLKKALLP